MPEPGAARRGPHATLAAAFLVAALATPAFWPTKPGWSAWVTHLLSLGALYHTVLAAWPSVVRPLLKRSWGRRALRAGKVVLWLALLPHLAFVHLLTFAVWLGISPTQVIVVALLEVALAFTTLRRQRRASEPVRIHFSPARLVGLIVLANSLFYPALCHWMWAPPSDATCRALERPGEVSRISPAAWVADPSQPYDLLYVPSERLLVAAFKMAGNITLEYWNNTAANRLFVARIEGEPPYAWAQLPMPGVPMPEFIEYDPRRRQVLLTRYGKDEHSVDIIDLADFPRLRKVGRISLGLDQEPNGIALHPDGETLSLFTFYGHRSWTRFARADLSQIDEPPPLEAGLSTNHIWHDIGAPRAYLSIFGRELLELQLDRLEVRRAAVPFGGGDIMVSPEAGRIFQTDYLFGAINVVDLESMTLETRLNMDFNVRAVHADAARDLLFVGSWFDGNVHVYRLSTLERWPLPPVPVGPYLRYFTYDAQRGDLYASSKCGVYQVRVSAFGLPSRHPTVEPPP